MVADMRVHPCIFSQKAEADDWGCSAHFLHFTEHKTPARAKVLLIFWVDLASLLHLHLSGNPLVDIPRWVFPWPSCQRSSQILEGSNKHFPFRRCWLLWFRLLISVHPFSGLIWNNFLVSQQQNLERSVIPSINSNLKATCYLPSICTSTEDTVTGSIGVPVWNGWLMSRWHKTV